MRKKTQETDKSTLKLNTTQRLGQFNTKVVKKVMVAPKLQSYIGLQSDTQRDADRDDDSTSLYKGTIKSQSIVRLNIWPVEDEKMSQK